MWSLAVAVKRSRHKQVPSLLFTASQLFAEFHSSGPFASAQAAGNFPLSNKLPPSKPKCPLSALWSLYLSYRPAHTRYTHGTQYHFTQHTLQPHQRQRGAKIYTELRVEITWIRYANGHKFHSEPFTCSPIEQITLHLHSLFLLLSAFTLPVCVSVCVSVCVFGKANQ